MSTMWDYFRKHHWKGSIYTDVFASSFRSFGLCQFYIKQLDNTLHPHGMFVYII